MPEQDANEQLRIRVREDRSCTDHVPHRRTRRQHDRCARDSARRFEWLARRGSRGRVVHGLVGHPHDRHGRKRLVNDGGDLQLRAPPGSRPARARDHRTRQHHRLTSAAFAAALSSTRSELDVERLVPGVVGELLHHDDVAVPSHPEVGRGHQQLGSDHMVGTRDAASDTTCRRRPRRDPPTRGQVVHPGTRGWSGRSAATSAPNASPSRGARSPRRRRAACR